MASGCAVINLYFLSIICLVEKVRKWQYFPIAFQSLCDLITCGICLAFKSLQDVLVRDKTEEGNFHLNGGIAQAYRSTWLGEDPPLLKCAQEFVLDIANDYRAVFGFSNEIFFSSDINHTPRYETHRKRD